jgi:DNA-binding CsgD family transcriptional regulator
MRRHDASRLARQDKTTRVWMDHGGHAVHVNLTGRHRGPVRRILRLAHPVRISACLAIADRHDPVETLLQARAHCTVDLAIIAPRVAVVHEFQEPDIGSVEHRLQFPLAFEAQILHVRASTKANSLGLTSRQLTILDCLCEGLSNKEIANRLRFSPKTVDHHVSAILPKLGAASPQEAAKRALEQQIIRPK